MKLVKLILSFSFIFFVIFKINFSLADKSREEASKIYINQVQSILNDVEHISPLNKNNNIYEIFKSLPPLLKGYLRLGAYVGNGAFIDKQFNTIDICIVLKLNSLKKRYINLHKKGKKSSKIIFIKNFLKNKSRFIKWF